MRWIMEFRFADAPPEAVVDYTQSLIDKRPLAYAVNAESLSLWSADNTRPMVGFANVIYPDGRIEVEITGRILGMEYELLPISATEIPMRFEARPNLEIVRE